MHSDFADFITKLRHEQLTLRDAAGQDVVAAIVADFPEALHSVDTEEKLVAANTRALQLYGYPLQELLGMSIYDLYIDKEEVRRGFQRLRVEGRLEVFTKVRTKGGDLLGVKMTSFALFDSAGKFVKTISILRDVSEQLELKSKLLQASRFSEMGKFSAGIAHDIRSPLTVLKGFTDCVLESEYCRRDAQVMSAAAAVRRAVAKIERFTTRLLQVRVSGTDEEIDAVDLTVVINDAVEMLDAKIRAEQVTVVRELPPECILQGRRQQLEQVFNNIISNACDAVSGMHKRGVTITVTPTATQVSVSIADTGIGIEEQLRAKIFEAFFTTKGNQQGTGIGLTIASEIVTAHQGHIAVSANKPQGTVFTVTLPRTQATITSEA